eukprot:6590936-Pyramimonas_sp.AAC.1
MSCPHACTVSRPNQHPHLTTRCIRVGPACAQCTELSQITPCGPHAHAAALACRDLFKTVAFSKHFRIALFKHSSQPRSPNTACT